MFLIIWHTFFFDPIYNGLIFFIDTVPGGDVGLSIVLLTLIVKIILLPLSLKAARTQFVMREIEPRLKELRKRHANNRERLARETMSAYKESGINPFSSILLMFVQIPIIIALYLSVSRGGGVPLPEINTTLLYSFVPIPQTVSMLFLGFVDIAAKSFSLAVLAGITQFLHANISLPKSAPREKDTKPSFKEDFARSMQMQMRYVMPLIIFFVAYSISAAIALYFVVSNIAMLAQEYIVRRQVPREDAATQK